MTYEGNVYTVSDNRWGNITITRKHDGANCFLQGDDSNDLRASIARLENEYYPVGPFVNFAQHLDAVLDAYESIIR
jgi:hypothetical protein